MTDDIVEIPVDPPTVVEVLTGQPGPQGPTGAAGADGADGAPGEPGVDGSDGVPGADGKTWHNGSGSPSGGVGVDGDFYLDTTADAYYGPKTSGAWGSATSLIGPAGADGAPGADGDDGAPGNDGAAGVGVPTAGTTGQILAKISNTDYDTEWIDPPEGGSGSAPEVRHSNDGMYDYTGTAPNGTAEGSSGWTVTRITLTSPPVVMTGSGTWTGRAGLTYS